MLLSLQSLLTARLALSAAAPDGGGCTGTLTEQEALDAEDARYRAQLSNDFAAMERLFGDDLVYIHSSTVLDTKQSFIESMRSGTVRYRVMKRGETRVRTYGCIAIVSGRARFEVTVKGEERTLELLFHAVWAMRTGGPQFVSWQATRVPPIG
jgi:hypothetical protein